jgi:hypothetical protein
MQKEVVFQLTSQRIEACHMTAKKNEVKKKRNARQEIRLQAITNLTQAK